jgi:hypothetical protein
VHCKAPFFVLTSGTSMLPWIVSKQPRVEKRAVRATNVGREKGAAALSRAFLAVPGRKARSSAGKHAPRRTGSTASTNSFVEVLPGRDGGQCHSRLTEVDVVRERARAYGVPAGA